MASTWGDSWSVAWGVSWDIAGPEPEIVAAGKMLKGELFKPKHTANTYSSKYPDLRYREAGVVHSAKILATVGGHARAEALSAAQRTAIASKAAKARWR